MTQKTDPDRLLDHRYDGIEEYDNPLPRWWLYLFYATILFSLLYALNLPGIGTGKGRIANYERDMAEARAQAASLQPAGGGVSEGTLLAAARDPATLASGKATFTSTCAPCHRPDGGGSIGPNLTDDYWIHGGHPLQILKTVTDGVPDKGMPTWGPVLKPDQLAAVVAYVTTLRGTHPPDPKAPQGTPEAPGAAGGR